MTFKGFIKVNYLRFFWINLLCIIGGFSAIAAGYVQMYWLTDLKNRNWQGVAITILLLLVMYWAAQTLIYISQYEQRVQEEKYNEQLRNQVADHYFQDGQDHQVANIQNRMTNDFELAKNNYFEWYPVVPFYASMLVASLIALLTIHWSVFLLSMTLDLISYFVPKLVQNRMQAATSNVSKQNKQYMNALAHWFAGIEELRRYFAGAKLLQVQASSSRKIENAHVHQTATQQELIIINGLCSIGSQILLMGLSAWLITKNLIIFGAIMSVQNFMVNASLGMQQTIQALSYMKATEPLMHELGQAASKVNGKHRKETVAPTGFRTENLRLQFKNGESMHFPDIEIKQGEKILLTGDSGAGKSTLFKLVLGSIKPSSGKIIFQDKDGKQVNPDMSKIGYIPQDPNLFPGTIEQNITMFNAKLNARVDQAIAETNFSEDIAKFKDGKKEQIDLDKLNISGGQRQKIVLARAKIHESDLIMIDEGTSAIDQKATMAILSKLVKSKATIIFIAHNFNEGMRQLFDREIHLVKE